MMSDIGFISISAIQFAVAFAVFAVLYFLVKFAKNRYKNSPRIKSSRFLNPLEYLPEEELSTIRQVFYLIMIFLLVIFILYSFIYWNMDVFYFIILDVIVSVYLAVNLEIGSFKSKLLLFFLIPFGSITTLLFGVSFVGLLDIFHLLAYLYYIWFYYRKFVEFTENNGLGITIIFLFLIIFVSFFITMIVEGVSPLDSINIVSNAFTSNGYTVLGDSGAGKLNAVFLVWSGFLLSGVGTATLTVAIVMRRVNGKFDDIEEKLARKNKKE